MNVDIHTRVARPSLLLYGSPIPTCINLFLISLCLIVGKLLTGIGLFFINQSIIFIITYKNVFAFEEFYALVVTYKYFKKGNFYV
jgi:hypothetical protein